MTETADNHYDVLVIGAGVGGLCAAARTAHGGLRTLLVESEDRVGGRASSFGKEGFTLATGAVAIERGGAMEKTYTDVGAELSVRFPQPANVFSVKGKTVNPAKGGWAFLLERMTKQGAKMLSQLGGAQKGDMPEDQMTLEDWVGRATKNDAIHRLFRNLAAAIFAVNADEIPAKAFLTYFTQKSAFRDFGFHPDGTIGVCTPLADVVTAHGGEVWLSSPVEALHVEDGKVSGARINRDGESVEVTAGAVISNIGPSATVALTGEDAMGSEYVEQIRRSNKPTANIIIHIASRAPLLDTPGLILFSETERLCNAGNMTATCPELAPEGWCLTVAYAVPRPAVGDFDEEAEVQASLKELDDILPGMQDSETRVLDVRVMKGEWPAQRAPSGYEMPRDTPIDNLWNVGDGVRDYADGGTQACALTAELVAGELLATVEA